MMVSPEHINEQKPENEQAPDPHEEQQVVLVGEKQKPWLEPLLRGIAIVVSLMSGIAAVSLVVLSYRPWLELGFENSAADQLAYLRTVAMLLVFLVALGGAVLFRSWWAILGVPLALSLGAVLTYYLSNQIAYELLHYDDVVFGVAFFAIIYVPSIAVIGAFFGSYFGMFWKNRGHITPPAPRRWETLLLQVLGIVMSLVGGFAISIFELPGLGISSYLSVWLTPILVAVPLTFISARLMGHWWAMLVVPFAFVVGQILMPILVPFGAGFDLLLAWPSYVIGAVVPATGAILGILTSKSFAPRSEPMLGMALLLSLGLYGVALGEAFLLALLLWPNALQEDPFLGVVFLAMDFICAASLLVLGSLISAKVHWLLALGVFLLSLLAAFGLGWLFSSQQPLVFFLTYGVVVVVLSLILLARVKGVWATLWRPLLVAGAGAAIAIAVLVARGPDAWRNPPNGIDVVLVSLGIGALILVAGFWFAMRRSKKPVLQA